MKKTIEAFYLFSKFAVSLVLFICLIFLLYIFYINYQKEAKVSKIQPEVQNELKQNIMNNTNLINNISAEIKRFQLSLDEIKKDISIVSNKNENLELEKFYKSIENLNSNFQSLSKEIEDIKNKKEISSISKNLELSKKGNNDIINLILIKYENNLSIYKEINYLKDITSNEKNNFIEKLLILSKNPYNGHEYLKKIFNEEVKIYLKKNTNFNSENFLNKIFLPYIEITPSTENKITDDVILLLKEVNKNIDNTNIENAYKNLKIIKDHDNFFKLTDIELKKYINFKNELFKLKI